MSAVRPCSAPKCRKQATVAHDVRPSYLSDFDARQPKNRDKIRHYEVCDEHDATYFGRGGFLSARQCERIQELVVR